MSGTRKCARPLCETRLRPEAREVCSACKRADANPATHHPRFDKLTPQSQPVSSRRPNRSSNHKRKG